MRELVRTYTANYIENQLVESTSGIGSVSVVEFEEHNITYRIFADYFDNVSKSKRASHIQRKQVLLNNIWTDIKFETGVEYQTSIADTNTYVDINGNILTQESQIYDIENITDGEGNIVHTTKTLKTGLKTEYEFLTDVIYPTINQVITEAIKRKNDIV